MRRHCVLQLCRSRLDRGNELQELLKRSKEKGAGKKLGTFVVIMVIVFVLVLIGGVVVLLSSLGGSGGASETTEEAPEGALVTSPDEPVLPVGVAKDSILRSSDNGRTFETYFNIATEATLGAVDVLSITFHPHTANEVVVSTYDDGLFAKQDDVNVWQPIVFPPKQMYSFVLDTQHPDTRAFVSGVEEKNGRIFRTDDKGATWNVVYAEPGLNSYVSALTQVPTDPSVILAGTSAGTLVRSIDGGDTWSNIGQTITGKIASFKHDSTKQSFVYLLANGKLYHSYDGGLTWENWEEVKDQEIKNLSAQAREASRAGNKAGAEALNEQVAALKLRDREAGTPSGIVSIVPDPQVSGTLYAGLGKGLYRSTSYGKYWQKLNIIESAEKFPIPSIAINPNDSNDISFVAGNSFYRSTNYGETWAVTPLDKTRNASFVAYDPYDAAVIYVGLSGKK